MPIDNSNMFSLTGINKTTDELVVMDLDNSTDNVSLHSSNNTNNIDTLNIKNILHKDINKDLNICGYNNNINPIIQINNTHQHINITSNLNVASNLNVISNLNVTSNLNLQGSIIISGGNNSLKSTTITEYINGNDNYSIINLCPHNGPGGGGDDHAHRYSGIDFKSNYPNYTKTSAFLRYIPTNNWIRGELHIGASEGLSADYTTSCSASLKIKSSGVEVVGTTTSSTLNVTGDATIDGMTEIKKRIHFTFGDDDTYPNRLRNQSDQNHYMRSYIEMECPSTKTATTVQTTASDRRWFIGTITQSSNYSYIVFATRSPQGTTHSDDNVKFAGFIHSAATDNTFGDQMNFTGQHRCVPQNIDFYNNINNYVGLIVYATGDYKTYNNSKEKLNIDKEAITINDSLPVVDLSNKKKQKSVFGIISNKEEEDRLYSAGAFCTPYPNTNDDKRLYINSVGEGAIWIVNTNGNLENGDYIQSSDVIGHGEKQTSEFLANYTVAKITCDCDFNINSTKYNCVEFVDSTSGNTYRKAFVGCSYHCG